MLYIYIDNGSNVRIQHPITYDKYALFIVSLLFQFNSYMLRYFIFQFTPNMLPPKFRIYF